AYAEGARDLSWSDDNRWLAVCGGPVGEQKPGQGHLLLRSAATGEVVSLPAEHAWHVTCLAFQPKGKVLATGAQDGTVRLRGVAARKALPAIPTATVAVRALCWHPDGGTLATAGMHQDRGRWFGHVALWDVRTGKLLLRVVEPNFFITSLAWSLDGKWL